MIFYSTYNLRFGKIKKIILLKLFYLIFFFNFFFISCSNPYNQDKKEKKNQSSEILISKEEKIWMDKFFDDFFLDSSAIYTLFGTKPLSSKEIIYASRKDWGNAVQPYLKNADIKEKERAYTAVKQYCDDYDFHKNWEKWISFIKQHPKSPFLFIKRQTKTKEIALGYILNIPEMVKTLLKNYDVFKKELGYDFDPISVTMDFENIDSPFWNQVFSNHLLMGIIYGYGLKNSYLFSMEMKKITEFNEDHSLFASIKEKEKDEQEPSLSHLLLPKFRSYRLPFNDDPILEKYKLERKKIQKELNEKNFFQKSLHQLTGSSN